MPRYLTHPRYGVIEQGNLTPLNVVNNLTSNATDLPLSAAQGQALNNAVVLANSDVAIKAVLATTPWGEFLPPA